MMGRIAAGTPIEAIQTRSSTINVPTDLLTAGDHFALEVRGDSMIDAGILDGDTVPPNRVRIQGKLVGLLRRY
jgi:repressor LexA